MKIPDIILTARLMVEEKYVHKREKRGDKNTHVRRGRLLSLNPHKYLKSRRGNPRLIGGILALIVSVAVVVLVFATHTCPYSRDGVRSPSLFIVDSYLNCQ